MFSKFYKALSFLAILVQVHFFKGVLGLDPPSVNLSDYKLSTDDHIMWTTPHTFLLPDYFTELEFECNSTYPTEWVLSFNPLEDDSLQQAPRVIKKRIISTSQAESKTANTVFFFSSRIRFLFRSSDKIQKFACQSIGSMNMKIGTTVTTRVSNQQNLYSVNIASNNGNLLETQNRYGSNDAQCSISIGLDLVRIRYHCRVKGNFQAKPSLHTCRNPDECNAILAPDRNRCNNAVSLECDSNNCASFNPKVEPGLIVCRNGGNSLAVKYSVKVENGSKRMELYNDEAPPESFISISQYSEKIYDGEGIDFVCTGSKYVFTKGFQWRFLTNNGTKEEIIDAKKDAPERVEDVHYKYVVTRHVIFNLTRYKDIVGVICYAPIWNSVDSAKALSPVQIHSPDLPQILLTSKRNFSVSEEKNITLTCPYSGIPKPKISWKSKWNNKTIEYDMGRMRRRMNHTFFVIKNGENVSELTLYLEKLTKWGRQKSFEVICHAENVRGSDEKSFFIEIDGKSGYDEDNKILGRKNTVLIIIVVTMLILICGMLWGGWLYILWLRRKNLQYVKRDIHYFLDGNPNIVAKKEDIHLVALKQPYNLDYDIPLDNVEMDRQNPLGSGQFGMVLKGTAFGGHCKEKKVVAIKTLKANLDPASFRNLMMELKVMIYVGHHDNIVNLLGSCTQNIYNMDLSIIMEYCPNGELEKYLRSHRQEFSNQLRDGKVLKDMLRSNTRRKQMKQTNSMCTVDLIMWSYQIACGMEYLACKNVIHGDLAARNVLLDSQLSAKICDFGLSRQLYQYAQYIKKHQAPLPWRWMSIESLRDLQFSTESDVWSYGILLWEIFTLAEVPYPGYSWNNDFLKSLIDGFRLHKPLFCPDDIDTMMKECWEKEPQSRPTFSELRVQLKSCLNSNSYMPGIPEEL